MANWHGYFGIENVGLNASQRATLITVLRALGPSSDPQPCMLNHWRTRLDGNAAIFEARFPDEALTVQAFKARLGAIFGIDPLTIDDAMITRNWGGQTTPVVTFSRGGTDYVRMALFGGLNATWAESGDACRAYLAENAAEWEMDVDASR